MGNSIEWLFSLVVVIVAMQCTVTLYREEGWETDASGVEQG